MPTTWNPSDKSATINLSGGNLVATGASFNFSGVRSTSGKNLVTGGKFYFEISCNGSFSDVRSWLGFAGNLASLGAIPSSSHTASLNKPGTTMEVAGFNPIAVALGAFGSNTYGVAVDFSAKEWWATSDGINWNAGGASDPATPGTGDFWTTQLSTDTTGHICCTIIDSGAAMTLNAGASAFAYPLPSGFVAWDDTPPPTSSFGVVIS